MSSENLEFPLRTENKRIPFEYYSHLSFVCLNCIWTTRQFSHQILRTLETGPSWVSLV